MEVALTSSFARRAVIAASALVSAAGLAAELTLRSSPADDQVLLHYLSLSYEANVPTWYTATLLFSCALLLALVASTARRAGEKHVGRWWVLAAGFLYMSLDESVEIHERLAFLPTTGVLYFSWVVPAAAIVAIVGVAYVPFLRDLPRASRSKFILAGAIYVGGAVAMELPLGYWTERHGQDNLGYAVIDWVEETMEIVGVTIFALSLSDHLARSGASFRFGPAGDGARP